MTATKRPKILFTTPILHHPPTAGPYLRVENSVKALSRISELYLYSRVPLEALGGAAGLSFYQSQCNHFYFSPSALSQLDRYTGFSKRAVNYAYRKVSGRDLFPAHWEPEKDFRSLLELADYLQVDLIWLSFGGISYPLLKYIKRHSDYKVVLETESIWSQFILRGLPFAASERERRAITRAGEEKQEEERWGARLADVTTAVSEVEADYYRSLSECPQRIHIFSNVIDLKNYQSEPSPPSGLKTPYVFLAGTFWRRSPMEDAARWAIKEVMPVVRHRVPGVRLYIVGTGSDRVLSDVNDPGVTIMGHLPSVLPHLRHASVSIVPLRYESGTRFKILEAGACGVPVVSTSLGAEGLPVNPEQHLLIADEPEEFARSIIRLIEDRNLAASLAKNLRKLVHENFSIESLVEEGRQILQHLVAGSDQPLCGRNLQRQP